MTQIISLDLTSWRPTLTPEAQRTGIRALEGGGVLVLPHLAFELTPSERRFLSPEWANGKAKNISLDGTRLKGARGLRFDAKVGCGQRGPALVDSIVALS